MSDNETSRDKDWKMDPEKKAEWVRRLRSGEYRQTKGYLAVKNEETGETGYCCLGVLCDYAAEAGAVEHAEERDFGNHTVIRFGANEESDITVLPESVKQWAGIPNRWVEKINMQSLIDMNDNGKSFEEIADVIEEHL